MLYPGTFGDELYKNREKIITGEERVLKRILQVLADLWQRMLVTFARFPLTIICLLGAVSLIFYLIADGGLIQSLDMRQPEIVIKKHMFTSLLGAFLGVTAQFLCERFAPVARRRLLVYLFSFLLIGGYFLILYPAAGISFEVSIRSFVAVFAMFCAFIWLPSCRDKFDFNISALIHLKAAFVALLYAAVLAIGSAAILAGIDILLFDISSDSYAYLMTIIWVFFAPVYYLSLLPHFNSEQEAYREAAAEASHYPGFLEILVSYIAIPLAAVYTMVFAAYFLKILVTFKWPAGQLGGMVLAYAAAGLIIYILASPLENRFAALYRRLFPFFLIPIVIMQLISVGIRLNAYGITESRYYVASFGLFSLVCGVLLIFKPVKRNGVIAVLAALLAIASVVPPLDAFSVSRRSQINRLETMLTAEGMLQEGVIKARADAPEELRIEVTNILQYLNRRGYIKYVAWLPEDFDTYWKMQGTFGFEPAYPNYQMPDNGYFNLSSESEQPYSISGYDIVYDHYNFHSGDTRTEQEFIVDGQTYKFVFERVSPLELYINVTDGNDQVLAGTGLYEFIQPLLPDSQSRIKERVGFDEMNLEVEENGYKLRVLLQNIDGYVGTNHEQRIHYDFIVMFGVPRQRL